MSSINCKLEKAQLRAYYEKELCKIKERLKNNYGNTDFHLEEITIFSNQLKKLDESNC
jgi:hypothetical protein